MVRALRPGDLEAVNAGPYARVAFAALGEVSLKALVDMAVAHGPAWAGLLDGAPVIVGGVWIWNPGAVACTGEAWAVVDMDRAWRVKVELSRKVRRFLDRVQADKRVARINAVVEADFKAGRKWARVLGFEHEAVMRKWLNGRDYCLFGRVV